MIREYRLADCETVVAIWRSATSLAHSFLSTEFVEQEAVNLRELYLPNAETWVLQKDQALVGFISLIGSEIGGLFLDPSCHGEGLGRALVDHAATRIRPLRVEVFEKNTIGRQFYKRYGFIQVGKYRHAATGEQTLKLVLPAAE